MTYSRFTLAFASVWFLLAALATAAGLLQKFPMPFPQLLIFLLTNLLLLLFWKQPQLHAWATRETIRTLVLIHVSRLVAGATFLIFYAQGKLPYAFAVPGGWGDIVVGLLALTVCWLSPKRDSRWPFLVWNIAGFADILFVVSTAARLGLAEPQSMKALTQFPLALLPTFLVPIIIATHLLIFFRLAVDQKKEAA